MKKHNSIEKIEDEILRLEFKLNSGDRGNTPSARIYYRQMIKKEILKKKQERENLIKSLIAEARK